MTKWRANAIGAEGRDRKMEKNIYKTAVLYLVMVLLIGGVYLHSVIEVFTA